MIRFEVRRHTGSGWYFIGPRTLRATSFFWILQVGRWELAARRTRMPSRGFVEGARWALASTPRLCDEPCPIEPSAGGCWLSAGHGGFHSIDDGTYLWPRREAVEVVARVVHGRLSGHFVAEWDDVSKEEREEHREVARRALTEAEVWLRGC